MNKNCLSYGLALILRAGTYDMFARIGFHPLGRSTPTNPFAVYKCYAASLRTTATSLFDLSSLYNATVRYAFIPVTVLIPFFMV